LVHRFMWSVVAEANKFDLDALFGHLRCSGAPHVPSEVAEKAQAAANALLDGNYQDVLVAYTKASTPLADLEAAYLGLLLWVDSKIKDHHWTLLKFVWDRVPGDSFGWGPKAVLREKREGDGIDAIHYVVLKVKENGFTNQENVDRIQKLGEIFLEFQPSERGQVFPNEEAHEIIVHTEKVGASKIELLDIVVGREFGKTLEERVNDLLGKYEDDKVLEKNFNELGQQIFNLFFQNTRIDAFETRPLLGFVQSDEMEWPRLSTVQDSTRREMMESARKAPIPVPVRHRGDSSYTLLHGDEWGRNFVFQSTETGRLRPIDFEDLHIKEVHLDQDRTVSEAKPSDFGGAGGDLGNRIENRYPPRLEAFSSAGAAGRLMTALLQKLSRDRPESADDWVKHITMPLIAGAHEGLEQMLSLYYEQSPERIPLYKGIFAQILLSMADWSAYWSEKGARDYWKENDREWLSTCIDSAWRAVRQHNEQGKSEPSGEFDDLVDLMNKEYEEYCSPRLSQASPKSPAEEIIHSLKEFYELFSQNRRRAEELREKINESVAEFDSTSHLKIIFQQELTLIQLDTKNYEEMRANWLNVLETLGSLIETHSISLIEGLYRRSYYWGMAYELIRLEYLKGNPLDSIIEQAKHLINHLDYLFLQNQNSRPELAIYYLYYKGSLGIEYNKFIQLERDEVGENRIDIDGFEMDAIFAEDILEFARNNSENLSSLSLSKATFIARRCKLRYEVSRNSIELNNHAIIPLLEIWEEVRRLPESTLRDHFLLQMLHGVMEDFIHYGNLDYETPLLSSFLVRIMECNLPPQHLDPAYLFDLLNWSVLRFPRDFSEHKYRLNALNAILDAWWNPLDRPCLVYARSTRSIEPESFRAVIFRFLISYLPNISINERYEVKRILLRIQALEMSAAWSTQSKETILPIDFKVGIERWLDGTLDIEIRKVPYPNELVQLLNDVLVGFVISEDAGGAVRRRGGRSHEVYQALEKQFGRPTDVHNRW